MDKEQREILKLRTQMVINYKQAYQKIKIKQLETLLSNIKSFKLTQNPLAEDELTGK